MLDSGLGPTAYLNSASWHPLNVLNGELAKIPVAVVPFHSPSVSLKEPEETVPIKKLRSGLASHHFLILIDIQSTHWKKKKFM